MPPVTALRPGSSCLLIWKPIVLDDDSLGLHYWQLERWMWRIFNQIGDITINTAHFCLERYNLIVSLPSLTYCIRVYSRDRQLRLNIRSCDLAVVRHWKDYLVSQITNTLNRVLEYIDVHWTAIECAFIFINQVAQYVSSGYSRNWLW